MIKLIRGGCYYMNGALVKENQAFLTAAQKETARKGTMSYRILKEHNRGDEENLKNIHVALQGVTIVCGDYTLSESFIDNGTFVYIDPPYRPISETSGFTAYTRDAFDDKEQQRLAEFIDHINSVGAKIVLSNSDPKNINSEDNFFEDLYGEYTIRRVEAARMINSKADKRGKIYELLISN